MINVTKNNDTYCISTDKAGYVVVHDKTHLMAKNIYQKTAPVLAEYQETEYKSTELVDLTTAELKTIMADKGIATTMTKDNMVTLIKATE